MFDSIIDQQISPEDYLENHALEIELVINDDVVTPKRAFGRICETLSRIGIPSKQGNTLFQSCHALYLNDRYYLCNFKELYVLDGRDNNLNIDDLSRRNTVAHLLENWGMIKVKNPEVMENCFMPAPPRVVKFAEKGDWELKTKFNIRKLFK